MARKWTEEERKKQAEAIRRWKPWEKATGPKTLAGKDACRMNALKDGYHTADMVHMRTVLRQQKAFVKDVERGMYASAEKRTNKDV